jgi:hypothetical protein
MRWFCQKFQAYAFSLKNAFPLYLRSGEQSENLCSVLETAEVNSKNQTIEVHQCLLKELFE